MKPIANRIINLAHGLPWPLIIAAAGWVLSGLVFLILSPLRGSLATVSLVMILFFVLPGFLVFAVLKQSVSASPWGLLVASFGVGVGIELLIAFVVRWLGLPLATIGLVLWLLELPLIALLYTHWRRGNLVSFQFSARSPRAKQADWILLALLAPVVGQYLSDMQWAIPLGGPTDWPKYLNYTSWILAHPQIPSSNMPQFYMQWQADFRVWWPTLAAITNLVRVDTTVLDIHWRYEQPILIALSVVAIYALACELFERPGARVATVIMQVAYLFGSLPGTFLGKRWVGYTVLYSSSEDKVLLSFLLIPIFCLLMLRFFQERKMSALLPLGFASLGAVLTHPLGFPFIALMAGAYGVLDWLAHPSRKIKVYLVAAVMMLPLILVPLVQRLARSPAPIDLQPTVGQDPAEVSRQMNLGGRLLFLSDEPNNYIASPQLLQYPITLLGTLIGSGLALRLRKDRSARYLFGATAAPLLVIYTPGLASLIGRVIGYETFWRFIWLLPSSLAVGWGLDALAHWLATSLGKHRRGVAAWGFACIVMVVFWGLGLPRNIPSAVEIVHFYNDGGVRYRTDQAIGLYVARLVKSGETVLAPVFPSQTNRTIFALAPDAQVVAWHRFSDVPLSDQVTRFYRHSQLEPADVDLLMENNVDYIVIPKTARLVPFLSAAKLADAGSVENVNIYRVNTNLDYVDFDPSYSQQDYDALARQIIAESGPEAVVMLDRPGPDEAGRWEALQKSVQRFFTGSYPAGPRVIPLPNENFTATLTQVFSQQKQVYVIFWAEGAQDPERAVEHMLNADFFITSTSMYDRMRLVRYEQLGELAVNSMSDAQFGKSITLKSYALTSTAVSPGEVLGVRLYWQADSLVDQRYKVYVHLMSSDGAVASQHDGEPAGYLAPTDTWIPGQIIVDNHAIVLPRNLPPGEYQLFVGLYQDETGRLPVTRNMQGAGDQVLLSTITIK